jgi:hypothetical protein
MVMNKKGQYNAMFSNFTMLIMFLAIASVSGLIAGVIYYDMNLIDVTFHTINFGIPKENNLTASNNTPADFQDILNIVAYPILGLRTSLPYLVYFMIFGFIGALGISAYLSSKNPVFFVLHILFTSLITYFSIIISGVYITLLKDPFINSMMVQFVIYNKIMLYLPQILFFTALLFGVIAFVNVMKPQTAGQSVGLNYGGDY